MLGTQSKPKPLHLWYHERTREVIANACLHPFVITFALFIWSSVCLFWDPLLPPVVVRTPSLVSCMHCKFHQAHGDKAVQGCPLEKTKTKTKNFRVPVLSVHCPTSPMKNITYLCDAPRIQIQGFTGWSLPVTRYSALAVISENNTDLILFYGSICADMHSYSCVPQLSVIGTGVIINSWRNGENSVCDFRGFCHLCCFRLWHHSKDTWQRMLIMLYWLGSRVQTTPVVNRHLAVQRCFKLWKYP